MSKETRMSNRVFNGVWFIRLFKQLSKRPMVQIHVATFPTANAINLESPMATFRAENTSIVSNMLSRDVSDLLPLRIHDHESVEPSSTNREIRLTSAFIQKPCHFGGQAFSLLYFFLTTKSIWPANGFHGELIYILTSSGLSGIIPVLI